MAKYGKKAQSKVKRAMHERKRGTLKSGRSGKKVTSRKQAIAIGFSEARKAGGKVPAQAQGRIPQEDKRSKKYRVSVKPPLLRPRNIVVLSSGSPNRFNQQRSL